MVLESLINPVKAEHRPSELFFIGILYASISLVIAYYIFGTDASLVVVFLTTMAAVPLVYGAIKMEERKDFTLFGERALLKEHGKLLSFLMFLFLGMTVAFSLWFVLLPHNVSQNMFSTQLRDIQRIDAVSNNVIGYSVSQILGSGLSIIVNNVKVLLLSLVFSFFYGAGAIFILTWNASVIAAAVGTFVQQNVGGTTLVALPLGLFRYLLHGIPEMAAYFIAGLAGGILSVAVIRYDFEPNKTKILIKDSIGLIACSFIILVFAAIIEVFVTPIFF